MYHIPLRATGTSKLCCKGIKAGGEGGPDVFWDLNITFKYFVCLKKRSVDSNVLSLKLNYLRTKVDTKIVIRDYSFRNYVVNVY